MKKLASVFFAFLIATGLVSCGNFGTSWNRKITVVVDTPSGEVSASSVQSESISDQTGWWVPPEARRARRELRGEAVVLDLGQNRYLFALLGKPDTFAVLRPGEAPLQVAPRLANLRGAKSIPRSEYPMFVTFTDVQDPMSVKEVKPETMSDTLGPGFALKSITLEITDEPVTDGKIELVANWLKDENPIFINWRAYPADHPLRSINKQVFLRRR
jgi:hypothetical protein